MITSLAQLLPSLYINWPSCCSSYCYVTLCWGSSHTSDQNSVHEFGTLNLYGTWPLLIVCVSIFVYQTASMYCFLWGNSTPSSPFLIWKELDNIKHFHSFRNGNKTQRILFRPVGFFIALKVTQDYADWLRPRDFVLEKIWHYKIVQILNMHVDACNYKCRM